MQEEHEEVKWYKQEKDKNRKLDTREKITNEQREGIIRCDSPSPRPVKQITTKEASKWSPKLFTSSKVRLFHSPHRHHIKHNKTKFQMFD